MVWSKLTYFIQITLISSKFKSDLVSKGKLLTIEDRLTVMRRKTAMSATSLLAEVPSEARPASVVAFGTFVAREAFVAEC